MSQYCMYFNANPAMVKTNDDATAYCNKEYSYLADDLAPEKNQFFIG